MYKVPVCVALSLLACGCSPSKALISAEEYRNSQIAYPHSSAGAGGMAAPNDYMRPVGAITPNAYGPGINMDGTGRPFRFVPQDNLLPTPPLGPITPNAYGPGIYMDGTGRAFRAGPGW